MCSRGCHKSACVPGVVISLIVCFCYSLTEEEKKKIQYKRKMLSLAREHADARKSEKVDRYYIPKDDVVSQTHKRFYKCLY